MWSTWYTAGKLLLFCIRSTTIILDNELWHVLQKLVILVILLSAGWEQHSFYVVERICWQILVILIIHCLVVLDGKNETTRHIVVEHVRQGVGVLIVVSRPLPWNHASFFCCAVWWSARVQPDSERKENNDETRTVGLNFVLCSFVFSTSKPAPLVHVRGRRSRLRSIE